MPNNINIKNIDLSNISRVEIKETPGKRSYGRRFKVIVNGQESDDMVLKKMLKQVEKISKVDKNLTPEQQLTRLESVQTILKKLKEANIAANKNYEERSMWKKFVTWILRWGNKGSHEDNIKKIEDALNQNITELKQELLDAEEAKISPLNPRLASNSKPIEDFIKDNLPVFQASIALHGAVSLKINGYDIHIKDPNTILIKNDSEELTLNFDNFDHIPDQFTPALKRTFEYVITSTSSYSNLSNKIVQSTLKEFPIWHLNQLAASSLRSELNADSRFNPAAITTDFYDDRLKKQMGVDSRGLTRAYVGTLVESFQNQDSLFATCKDGFKCPRIERTPSRDDPVLNCTKNEEEVYYNLGMLLRSTYNSDKQSFATGVYFSDILFKTALLLPPSQLQKPFSQLTRLNHIKIAMFLIDALPWDPESTEQANVHMALRLCLKIALDRNLDLEDQKAALKALSTAALVGVNDEGMQKYLDENLLNANMEAIKADREGFIDQLYQSIFSSKTFITQLNGASLGEVLAPIHSITRGMAVNDQEKWEVIKKKGAAEFSLRVQGEINKQTIHDALKHEATDRENELEWLKEWILNDATNDDIKNFLRFISGSTGLPKEVEIEVQGCYGKHPIANTCYIRINLPSNASKEEFVANLREAIQVSDFGRQ